MALKASPADQRLLLDLQAIDTRIRQIEHRGRNLPQTKRIAELDASIAELDREVLERLGATDDLGTEISRIENDFEVVSGRLAKDRARIDSGVDAKSQTAIEHEIASLESRQTELDDIQLEVMERQDAADAALVDARRLAEEARSERAGLVAERDAAAVGIAGEVESAASERRVVAHGVPADLLALYDRQRERYGIGASHLERRMSTASGVELTASELNTVRLAAPDDVLQCPDSSAILVRTDESGI